MTFRAVATVCGRFSLQIRLLQPRAFPDISGGGGAIGTACCKRLELKTAAGRRKPKQIRICLPSVRSIRLAGSSRFDRAPWIKRLIDSRGRRFSATYPGLSGSAPTAKSGGLSGIYGISSICSFHSHLGGIFHSRQGALFFHAEDVKILPDPDGSDPGDSGQKHCAPVPYDFPQPAATCAAHPGGLSLSACRRAVRDPAARESCFVWCSSALFMIFQKKIC